MMRRIDAGHEPEDNSRFLIAPERNIDGVEQRYKIASGLLGGFGGFFDGKFRALDQRGDDVRAVLAELVSPAFSFRTPQGIAVSAHLALDFVAEALAQLRRVDSGKPFRVWRGTASGRQVFTLESRKPAWFKSLPVIRQLFNFLEVPTVG